MEKQFRFQDLEIWQKAAGLSGAVFAMADALDRSENSDSLNNSAPLP
jgi:hypothetical protein